MKKIVTPLLFCSVTAFGQIQLTHHAPRIGDEIIKQQVEFKDPGRSGESVIWDFGELKPLNSQYTLSYLAAPVLGDSLYVLGKDSFLVSQVAAEELFVGVEHYTRYYYQLKNQSLYVLGYENPTTLVHHKKPLLSMSHKQIADSPYRSEGLYSSKEKFHTEGKVHLELDASGKMVLPSKDTLEHVIRIKTVQHIIGLDTLNPLNMQIETHKWYAQGYRYPVFETIETFNHTDTISESIFSTAFFYPPQEHYYLLDDALNRIVLDSIWNDGHKEPIPNIAVNSYFTSNFYPNPVRSTLYLEFLLSKSADVTITLYDLNERIEKTFPKEKYQAGMYSKTVDCSSLFRGTYIVSFIVNGQIMNAKIYKK